MKISACIITRDEEENLPRCLGPLRGLVDEIVVVDSGSTDRTIHLAIDCGARVISQPWSGYVGQKNFAIAQAHHDWVLSLDADEELDTKLIQALLEWKQSQPDEDIVGYEFRRVVYYQERWIRFGDWYPDRLVRLFRRNHACFAGGAVHERLEIRGRIETLPGEIIHHSFRDESDYLARMDHYSDLWAQSAFEGGKRALPWSAMTHATVRFLRGYIIKGGWRGGRLGWRLAWLGAREVWMKYTKLRRMGHPQPTGVA